MEFVKFATVKEQSALALPISLLVKDMLIEYPTSQERAKRATQVNVFKVYFF